MLSNKFCCSNGPQSENERKQNDKQILGSCQRAEKSVEHGEGGTNCSCYLPLNPKSLEK